MDWAEKIAEKIFEGWEDPTNFRVDYTADVAEALRKARADGKLIGLDEAHDALGGLILAQADKLEKGGE